MSEQERDVLEGLEGYTPGPWVAGEDDLEGLVLAAFGPIATINWVDGYHATDEANIRLITLAPELVEEVRRLRARVAELERGLRQIVAKLLPDEPREEKDDE